MLQSKVTKIGKQIDLIGSFFSPSMVLSALRQHMVPRAYEQGAKFGCEVHSNKLYCQIQKWMCTIDSSRQIIHHP